MQNTDKPLNLMVSILYLMQMKGFLVSMVLIIIGGLVLSQDFPQEIQNMQLFGWVPLVFGLIIMVLTIKEELTH